MKHVGIVVKSLFLFILVKYITLFGVNSLFSYLYMSSGSTGDLPLEWLNNAANVSTILSSIILLIVLFKWQPVRWAHDQWERLTPFYFSLLTVLGFLGFALNSIIISYFRGPYDQIVELSRSLFESSWTGVIGVVLFVPLVEELIFRRVCIESFKKEMGPFAAIVLSALLFGVLHMQPLQILSATLLGLLFGVIYHFSRSLLPTLFLHVLNNGLYVYNLLTSKEEVESIFFTKDNPYILFVLILLLLLFGFTFYLAYRRRRLDKSFIN